jgi:hypothetical protein
MRAAGRYLETRNVTKKLFALHMANAYEMAGMMNTHDDQDPQQQMP